MIQQRNLRLSIMHYIYIPLFIPYFRRAITFVFRIRKLWTFLRITFGIALYILYSVSVAFIMQNHVFSGHPPSLSDLLLNIQPPKIAHTLFTLLFIRVFVFFFKLFAEAFTFRDLIPPLFSLRRLIKSRKWKFL